MYCRRCKDSTIQTDQFPPATDVFFFSLILFVAHHRYTISGLHVSAADPRQPPDWHCAFHRDGKRSEMSHSFALFHYQLWGNSCLTQNRIDSVGVVLTDSNNPTKHYKENVLTDLLLWVLWLNAVVVFFCVRVSLRVTPQVNLHIIPQHC